MERFTFTWKIESFNLSVNKKGTFLSSPTFIIDSLENTAWFLQIYPYGECDDSYVACYLNRSSSDEGSMGVLVDFSFCFVLSDGSEQLLRSFKRKIFDKSELIGCNNLIRRDDLLNYKEKYLPKYMLTVQCHIDFCYTIPPDLNTENIVKSFVSYLYDKKSGDSVSEVPPDIFPTADFALRNVKERFIPHPTQCLARTRIRLEKRSLIWRIENFSKLAVKQRVSLPLTSVSTLIPSLLLTFYLDNEYDVDQLVQIQMKKMKSFTSVDIIVFCEISVLNYNSRKLCEFKDDVYFFDKQSNEQVWHFPSIVKKSKLMGDQMVYLHNDTLSLQFEFAFSDGAYLNQLEDTTYSTVRLSDDVKEIKNLMSLRNDLQSLIIKSKLSDVNLLIGEDKFSAHKAVLSARSPVFKDMFEQDRAAKKNDNVKVLDLDTETLTRMLKFMYGERVKDLEYESAARLYFAADKYQCSSLKDECAEFLSSNLNVTNVYKVLKLAHSHQDEDIKIQAHGFIKRRLFYTAIFCVVLSYFILKVVTSV